MKFNFAQLTTAIDSSIMQMSRPRKERLNAIKQYVGTHYAEEGAEWIVPTNLLELAVTIYSRQLAARAPRAMISTSIQSLIPFAKNMELAINQIPDEISLGRTLRRAVVEAIFSIGIIKVGIYASGKRIMDHEYGESYADVVTLDDYFLDYAANRMEAIAYEGNDYWMSLQAARDMSGNDKLQADEHTTIGDDGGSRAEGVSKSENVQEYGARVRARDVWIPDTGQLITYGITTKKQFGDPIDWDGPDTGPYRKLTFSDVPGNLMPLAPVALMLDLHELANMLYRKLGRQADAKKTVAAFAGGNDDDVNTLQGASDGDGIAYHGQKPEQITVGGIDQPTLLMYQQTKGEFTYLAGNLDSLGGLAPMSDTVGQDQMLSAAANGRMDYMKDQTIDFAKGIMGDLAWYAWTDPVRERVIEKQVEGTDIVLRSVWSAETRDGDFLDYNLDIDTYSMGNDTPSIKLQKIGQVMAQYVTPLLPQIEAQGGQVDVDFLLDLVGKLSNLPELKNLVKFDGQPPDQQQPQGNAQPALQSPNTTRTNIRVNRPGATRQGQTDVMSRLLAGGKLQESEAQSLGRNPG